MKPGTVNKNLLGALAVARFVREHDGAPVRMCHPEGRIFRGDDAANALRAEGFDVVRWTGPRDPHLSDEAWAWMAKRAPTWIALRPTGKVAV